MPVQLEALGSRDPGKVGAHTPQSGAYCVRLGGGILLALYLPLAPSRRHANFAPACIYFAGLTVSLARMGCCAIF